MLWRGKWLHFSLTLPRRFRKKSYITQRVVPDFQRFPWTQFKAGLCTSGLFKPKDRSNFCTTVDNKSIIPLDDDAVNSYLRIQRTERPWRTSRLVKSRFFVVFFFSSSSPCFSCVSTSISTSMVLSVSFRKRDWLNHPRLSSSSWTVLHTSRWLPDETNETRRTAHLPCFCGDVLVGILCVTWVLCCSGIGE